jgi:hypothetical protein
MLNVIQNIYKDIKSNIIFNNSKSDYFPCDNGIRQGENLFPFLFAIFFNDLEDFLEPIWQIRPLICPLVERFVHLKQDFFSICRYDC